MRDGMRILVCGGRKYADKTTLWDTLDKLWRAYPHDTLTIIQGGATGADQIAREWCEAREVPYDNYPADWKHHGRAAGPIRNQIMIDQGRPNLVLAFKGGAGTADMVRKARAAGIEVIEVRHD